MGKNVTDETTFEHPSYGLVGFHHRTGGAMRLFGSCVEDHHHTVALTIKRASLARSNTGDRFSPGDDLIEVVMSSAQFAELLTTMNVYAGTPCTITRFGGRVGSSCRHRAPLHEPTCRKLASAVAYMKLMALLAPHPELLAAWKDYTKACAPPAPEGSP